MGGVSNAVATIDDLSSELHAFTLCVDPSNFKVQRSKAASTGMFCNRSICWNKAHIVPKGYLYTVNKRSWLGGVVVSAGALQQEGAGFDYQSRAYLYGICMFSPIYGFSLGTLNTDKPQQKSTEIAAYRV